MKQTRLWYFCKFPPYLLRTSSQFKFPFDHVQGILRAWRNMAVLTAGLGFNSLVPRRPWWGHWGLNPKVTFPELKSECPYGVECHQTHLPDKPLVCICSSAYFSSYPSRPLSAPCRANAPDITNTAPLMVPETKDEARGSKPTRVSEKHPTPGPQSYLV